MRLAIAVLCFSHAFGLAQLPMHRMRCLPRKTAPLPRKTAPVAQGMFGNMGIDARAMKRMSEMKRADEPLEEEMLGLCVVGVGVGALAGGGAIGALLGSQLAPMLAQVQGPNGETFRKAGWATWSRVLKVKSGVLKFWRRADADYDIRGRITRFDAPGKWTKLDAAFDLTGKMRAAAQLLRRFLWVPLVALWGNVGQFCNRSGITKTATAAWEKTTIPAQWRAFEQEQVLRARMRQMRNQGEM